MCSSRSRGLHCGLLYAQDWARQSSGQEVYDESVYHRAHGALVALLLAMVLKSCLILECWFYDRFSSRLQIHIYLKLLSVELVFFLYLSSSFLLCCLLRRSLRGCLFVIKKNKLYSGFADWGNWLPYEIRERADLAKGFLAITLWREDPPNRKIL